MSRYEGIIGVDQLRQEIGDPTTNTQFAGYVTDDMLENIIDRHEEWLEDQSLQRINKGQESPVFQTYPHTVSLSKNNRFPGLAHGTLDSHYFPYSTEALITSPSNYEGEPLDYDPTLIDNKKKIFYDGFFFDVKNRDVLVYPEDITEATVFVPLWDEAVGEIMGDMISEVNNNIINRARQMLEAREREFAEPAYAGGGPSPIPED